MVGLFSVANSKRFYGFSSYSFLMASVLAFLRSSLSFSMSMTPFLNKFFGTGIALCSLERASGYGITFGFGLVKLNGFISVTFFGWVSMRTKS